MAKAAHIGVLENGFAGEAASALDALGWTHVTVPITFDPLQRSCLDLVDSKNSPSPPGLWELWETLRVFQRTAGRARRGPQARQLPQPVWSCRGLVVKPRFGFGRADEADRGVHP